MSLREFYFGLPPLIISSFFHKTIMYYRGFLESNKNTGMVKRYAVLLEFEFRIATGFYIF